MHRLHDVLEMVLNLSSKFVLVHNHVADPAADGHTVIDDECTDGQDSRTAVSELAEHIAASTRAYADVFAGLPVAELRQQVHC